MITTRAERIATIIEQRHPLADKVAEARANLERLASVLRELERERGALIPLAAPDTQLTLAALGIEKLLPRISIEIEAMGRLERRFRRGMINLGVVGRARQGKSRLLQTISGLGPVQIPDGDRQHCTGVRSMIQHMPGGPPRAEVRYYSEREILDEIIAPYFAQLFLGSAPASLTEFADKPLPPLPTGLGQLEGWAEPKAKYEHLRQYRDRLPHYRGLLQARSPERVPPERIREYVAQDTPSGDREYFNYLAVREVQIVCTFPHGDVGKIGLVDMPGLGDTGIGDQERLVKALGEDIDVVLFVRMPKSLGDYWADVDVQLYDLARRALTELPLDRWSLGLLNRTAPPAKNGDNAQNCADLAGSARMQHIDVVDMLTVNCADTTDVGAALDQILAYLIDHIAELDRLYAQSCQDRLLALHGEVAGVLEQACNALGVVAPVDGEYQLFLPRFKERWRALTQGLMRLLRRLRQLRDEPNPSFQEYIDRAIKDCRANAGLPSLAEVEARADHTGSLPTAYSEYMDDIRTRLTRNFAALDGSLALITGEMKANVADILRREGWLDLYPASDAATFLTLLSQDMPESTQVRNALQTLAGFELSYRGFVHYRLRPLLDRITPDSTFYPLSEAPTAEEAADNLRTLFNGTLYKLAEELADWLADPSKVAFAVTEDFVDQVLRSAGAEDEWSLYYHRRRADIWREDFEQLGAASRLRLRWESQVDQAIQANAAALVRFL